MGVRNTLSRAVVVAAVAGLAILGSTGVALAASKAKHPEVQDWKFAGLFGEFDIASIQRGLQVYLEVCSACHNLSQVAYRNLMDLGLSEDAVKVIAEQYEVTDGPDEEGEMYQRPARPSDKFVLAFPNENAARVANNGAFPPDLSLTVKAHPGGADYVYAVLTGFEDEAPEGIEISDGMNYNPYFSGGQIAMALPLFEDGVEYTDGTKATVEQMAGDVTNFMQWAAEPEMEDRKRIGWKVVLFLLVLSALLYATKRKIWSDLH